MKNEEIQEKIASFSRWHYQFDLRGNITPIVRQDVINRHQQRKRYFFDPLVKFLGGSLAGKRVLDLGCNAGFWSLHAVLQGCAQVVGIDGRQMHIDQANFVFEVNEIDKTRYSFHTGNLFTMDIQSFGEFDIVFCLGLMYHVSKPVALLEIISGCNTDLLIIDTDITLSGQSQFSVSHESIEYEHNAVDYELVLQPSRQAVVDVVSQFGYSSIILKPQFENYEGSESYRAGYRRAFVCSKHSDLSRFPGETEPVELPPPAKPSLFRKLTQKLLAR